MQLGLSEIADQSIEVSVLIPTRNRADSLHLLLESLARAKPPAVGYEVIVADNGSTDGTPTLLSEWTAAAFNRHAIRVDQHGKTHALNVALTMAKGRLIAFLDHDQVVEPDYLVEMVRYFASHDCAAAQGAMLWPAEATSDPEVKRLLDLYGVVPFVDDGDATTRNRLCGGNMVVRREILDKIGTLNEALGPGAAGSSEDDELSDRILATGAWIGYMGHVRIIHGVNPKRLTEEYFCERARQQGRSRYVYKHNNLWLSILPNLTKAIVFFVIFAILRKDRKKYRYKARCYMYGEMLRLVVQRKPSLRPIVRQMSGKGSE